MESGGCSCKFLGIVFFSNLANYVNDNKVAVRSGNRRIGDRNAYKENPGSLRLIFLTTKMD